MSLSDCLCFEWGFCFPQSEAELFAKPCFNAVGMSLEYEVEWHPKIRNMFI